jgi:hypothetical protein
VTSGRHRVLQPPEFLTARGKRLNRHALHLPHAIPTRIDCLVTHRLNIGPERFWYIFPKAMRLASMVSENPVLPTVSLASVCHLSPFCVALITTLCVCICGPERAMYHG